MSIIESEHAAIPVRPAMRRPRSRGQASLFLFAFTAAAAFVLVTVVDPYSGATASPYFQVVGVSRPSGPAQEIQVAAGYANTVTRDSFTVNEKPIPVPVPVAAPVASKSSSSTAPTAAVPDPGSAQAIASGMVADRGWGDDQFNCLVSLWKKESGWRVNAENSSSGAYGIPQALPGSKMATSGDDWQTNAATQIDWGLGYISGRYGTPCGAWAHSGDVGWY
ncbi:lytic transglycosylase domain-containing protein [Cryobacterium sp. TMT1-21]|uniref:Lytic transglycosylase domain-containing protein n=1 Tax=Cryobacterium shii TaxID=1259235 RepID=A0AAQ2HGW7_9MICO|nr:MULTISPECIES: lytic transglycosylase domain-containing protein [Cryobacterium]TFC52380.1 lytic transglycosylase domain-containing protein [Cryobacterium shii]TFC87490.1 lytic transglycosylase domain-containing protein [Cryobacterium sp. TmT2-59]TFD10854.1 lytic transglycosylase domain-containing protein [Cryobacterium sp. TMT1-21]TFD16540.1 lytic transglycosylase domain-containing protein [Cryobacterium sp. TMT2-23]TFD20509.1 lytic transglycosylase domain-containing protein [Cryobacterium s